MTIFHHFPFLVWLNYFIFKILGLERQSGTVKPFSLFLGLPLMFLESIIRSTLWNHPNGWSLKQKVWRMGHYPLVNFLFWKSMVWIPWNLLRFFGIYRQSRFTRSSILRRYISPNVDIKMTSTIDMMVEGWKDIISGYFAHLFNDPGVLSEWIRICFMGS